MANENAQQMTPVPNPPAGGEQPERAMVPVQKDKPGIPKMLVSLEEAKGMISDFVELKRQVIMADKANYATVQRYDPETKQTAEHSFIRKSGWQLIDAFFGINHQLIEKYQEIHEGKMFDESLGIPHFTMHVKYRTILPNGRFVEHEGACSTMEKRFQGKNYDKGKIYHDTVAMAETRATNRGTSHAVGAGDVSFEEIDPEDVQGPITTSPAMLAEPEARAREAAKTPGHFGCPHCLSDFASLAQLQLHVHKDHQTKSAYPCRWVPTK